MCEINRGIDADAKMRIEGRNAAEAITRKMVMFRASIDTTS